MDPVRAREIISSWTKEQFGRLLQVREVNVIRRAAGRVWSGELYCTMREGEILVGTVGVDEQGELTKVFGADELADAFFGLRASASAAPEPAAPAEDDFSDVGWDEDFSDLTASDDPSDEIDDAFVSLDPSSVQEQVSGLIASGEREALLKAREMLPQMLSRPDIRGQVLCQMGELELLLGELDLGVNYLEAAAREFADVANIDELERVAGLVFQVIGAETFDASAVKGLLDRARARMRPIDELSLAPLFVGLGQEEMFVLQGACNQISITQGEDLLTEGEPATMAFVVKSGVLSIRIETGSGSERIVRSCFPGDFIGESSVLGELGATCTATVRGEVLTSLWQFDGTRLREVIDEYPEIGARIESARTLHRLDSFMSMHEATAALDVAVRDQLLSCINGINRYSGGEILGSAGELPPAVYLVADGNVEFRVKGQVVRKYDTDSFVGLRDSLHELPLEGEFVTAGDCLLVRFDPARLKVIADAATPEVVAVLEKME